MPAADTPPRLDTLQAGRAAAAFAVVLFHLDTAIWSRPQYYRHELFAPFRMGDMGVEFFFVLSGFLMTWLYADRIGDRAAAKTFLWKRALRIYPPYWAVLLPAIPLYFLMPGLGAGNATRPVRIVTDLLLLPTNGVPSLSVAWTLQFEVFFYLMFAGVLAFPRLFKPLAALCLLAAVGRHFIVNPGFPLSFVTSPWILLFGYGVAAALVARRRISRPMLCAGLGLALFVAAAAADDFTPLLRAVGRNATGIGAAIALAGLVVAESQGRIRVPRWLVYGGDISYALYLAHTSVMAVGIALVFRTGLDSLPEPLVAIALVAASLAIAILLHEIVEKRLMKLRPKGSGANLGVENSR